MNRPVSPAPASSGNPFCAAVSSTRTAVLPTATIRPPAALVSFTSLAVAAGSSYHSGSITCRRMSSQVTGLKVPGPTCSVTYAVLTPCAFRACNSGSVKCRPAVGAGIVVAQDRLRAVAALGQLLGAPLAEPDAVAVAAAGELDL